MSQHHLTEHLAQRNVSTPQSQPIPGREAEMQPNNAGGFGFGIDKWQQLRRFLILGSEGGTYYVGEKDLTKANFAIVEACLKEQPINTVDHAWQVYKNSLAPKPDQAIFVLAFAAAKLRGDDRKYALQCVPNLRIATHLFMWKQFYEAFGGYSRSVRSALAQWYNSRNADDLAYQMCKYQSRNGHAHWDVLNVAHPVPLSVEHAALFKWAITKTVSETAPKLVHAMKTLSKENSPEITAQIIKEYGLTREMLATEQLNSEIVWRALLDKMPLHALIRNLGVMSQKGLFKPFSSDMDTVIARITDANYISKSHMHPVALFIAAMTYGQGHGMKGKGQWDVVPQIAAALDHATTLAFANVKPCGQNIVVAIDGSGSMEHGINGYDYISCRQAAIMMALATVRSEPKTWTVGFTAPTNKQIGGRAVGYGGNWIHTMSVANGGEHGAWPVAIGKNDSFRSAIDKFNQRIDPSGTDCASVIRLALAEKWEVDAFVLYTDNETWAGTEHVAQSLQQYNRSTGRNAKIVSVAMASNDTSIVDPTDPNQLNCVGFDATTPQVISAFVAGEL